MAITSLWPFSVGIAGLVGRASSGRWIFWGGQRPLVGPSSATWARRPRNLKDACVMERVAEQTTMTLAARLQAISPGEIRDRQ